MESTDRGVVDIRMKALINRANIGWWLASLSVVKRRKKVMSELWPMEERNVSSMK